MVKVARKFDPELSHPEPNAHIGCASVGERGVGDHFQGEILEIFLVSGIKRGFGFSAVRLDADRIAAKRSVILRLGCKIAVDEDGMEIFDIVQRFARADKGTAANGGFSVVRVDLGIACDQARGDRKVDGDLAHGIFDNGVSVFHCVRNADGIFLAPRGNTNAERTRVFRAQNDPAASREVRFLHDLHIADGRLTARELIDIKGVALIAVDIISERGQKRFTAEALNDAVVANGSTARIVDLELSEGDKLVNTYRADGLVIATPTGSTAYSLSAGGPIIDPKLSCFCVTPICPHSLVARPLIFPDTATLEVKNTCVRERVLHLTVDGKATFDLFFGDVAVITKSSVKTKLLRIKNEDFYSKIRMKKFV